MLIERIDIKACQNKGKTILLSLGGAAGSYGFSNDDDATAFADTLWDTFGNGESDTRPFGDAIVDGFDLDIEGGGSTGYTTMVKQLRSHFKKDRYKNYYITGAPQCPYPDAMLGPALETAEFDAVFVQFYNNYCSVTSSSFNFETWDHWAKKISKNKEVKVFLGVSGSSAAAGSGYVPFSSLKPIVQDVHSTYSSFGGVVSWDASASYGNINAPPNYQKAISGLVSGLNDSGSSKVTTKKSTKTTKKSTKATNKSIKTSKATTKSATKTHKTVHSTRIPKSTKTTTQKADETTKTSTPTIKEGAPCKGRFACSGTSYATCVHNKWVLRSCPASLVCLSTTDGTSVYCAQGSESILGVDSAKAYNSKSVNAQFSLDGVLEGKFNATLNIRSMKHVFKKTIKVQFNVNSGTRITHVTKGSVSQSGNKVMIKFFLNNNESMALIIGIQGTLPKQNTFVGPSMNSMKFY
ncbi:Chitinase 1 [Rhizopus stolonifer]|uniref:chitinase n=1 Tax=Rhizopus stolonifer TaxID=4846 RepID=A0A367ITG9_RHIST|nr:Chitinase 1 [Rhizopus stolonifer]